MERVMGIEPTPPAWKAGALPLSYTRTNWSGREDLNLRPPAPKAGALAKLRHAPPHSQTDIHNITTTPSAVSTAFLGSAYPLQDFQHAPHGPGAMADPVLLLGAQLSKGTAQLRYDKEGIVTKTVAAPGCIADHTPADPFGKLHLLIWRG